MALFKKKKNLEEVIADFEALSDEEKEQFRSHITESETEKVEDEPAVEEDTEVETETEEVEEAPEVEETEEVTEDEVAEVPEEETPVEEEAPEAEVAPEETEAEEATEATEEEVETEVKEETEARDAKFEAFLDEWKVYKEKIDKVYDRLEENDEPAEEVGLSRQDSVGDEKDDEELSAYEYAVKYGKY